MMLLFLLLARLTVPHDTECRAIHVDLGNKLLTDALGDFK